MGSAHVRWRCGPRQNLPDIFEHEGNKHRLHIPNGLLGDLLLLEVEVEFSPKGLLENLLVQPQLACIPATIKCRQLCQSEASPIPFRFKRTAPQNRASGTPSRGSPSQTRRSRARARRSSRYAAGGVRDRRPVGLVASCTLHHVGSQIVSLRSRHSAALLTVRRSHLLRFSAVSYRPWFHDRLDLPVTLELRHALVPLRRAASASSWMSCRVSSPSAPGG